jgi:hypothetical protein
MEGYCKLKKGNIEEKIEVTGRRGIRRKQLWNDLKETEGYWKLEKMKDRRNDRSEGKTRKKA